MKIQREEYCIDASSRMKRLYEAKVRLTKERKVFSSHDLWKEAGYFKAPTKASKEELEYAMSASEDSYLNKIREEEEKIKRKAKDFRGIGRASRGIKRFLGFKNTPKIASAKLEFLIISANPNIKIE